MSTVRGSTLFALLVSITIQPSRADDTSTCYNPGSDKDERIAACSRLIALNPKNTKAYFNRGSGYADKREDDQAISDYNQAIQLDSTFDPAYSYRGNSYLRKGDYDRAISDFKEVIRLDPSNAFVSVTYYRLGNAYYYKGGDMPRT
jgi:tetratricopeptide (TPR) repeat protein